MYRDGANGIVYLGDLVEKLDSQYDHDAEHCPHDCRAQRRDCVTAGGNAHQASKSGVIGHRDVGLAVANPCKDERRAAGDRRGQVGIEENEASTLNSGICVHRHSGSAIEAKPAEPEDKHTQRRKGQVVPENGVRFAILAVLAEAGAKHLRTDESTDAADHVYRRGTSKIMESKLAQPASTPDPVARDRVDENGDAGRIDAISAKLRAFGHRP